MKASTRILGKPGKFETEQPAVMAAEDAAADRWYKLMRDANAGIFARIFEPATDDRLPVHHTDRDGTREKSRLRQRAVSHALKWGLDIDETQARLSESLLVAVHAKPEILDEKYPYILNAASFGLSNADRVERYRNAHIYGPSLDATIDDTGASLADIIPDPEDTLTTTSTHYSPLFDAINNLEPDQRAAFVLQYIEKKDRTRAALEMDKTENQVRYLTRKALACLRAALTPTYRPENHDDEHATDCTCRLCRKQRQTDATSPTARRLPSLDPMPEDRNTGNLPWTRPGYLVDPDAVTMEEYAEMAAM